MYPPMKHVVDSNIFGEASGAVKTIPIAIGTLNPDPYTNTTNVRAGSIIGSINCQIEMSSNILTANTVAIDWLIGFDINNQGALPSPAVGGVGASHVKNQVFHQDGGFQETGTLDIPKPLVWNFVLKIPRAWRQINEADQINFMYKYSAGGAGSCDTKYRFIYTEYFP